jgi:hypothetical protein
MTAVGALMVKRPARPTWTQPSAAESETPAQIAA